MNRSRWMVNLTTILLFALHHELASAAVITAANWHLATDSLGGLRQSTYAPTVWFAVSQSNTWQIGDVYEPLPGFHWASTAEGNAIFGTNANISPPYVYYSQGGWTGYSWEGQTRYFFRFSDSHVTGSYKHVGNYDSHQLQTLLTPSNFAGLVLIQDPVAVPEPSSFLLFGAAVVATGVARRLRTALQHPA